MSGKWGEKEIDICFRRMQKTEKSENGRLELSMNSLTITKKLEAKMC